MADAPAPRRGDRRASWPRPTSTPPSASNRALNAWLSIDRDEALGAGRRRRRPARRRPRRGRPRVGALHPLLGIPVALKDLISVEGGQCTAGSRILEGYIAPYDAHITERLRDVGAVLLGKTNMDEFAMGSSNEHSAYGPIANPWDLETVPGGSAAAARRSAVAAYHAPLSHRHRHRRLDPPARGADRHRRAEADLRPASPLRDRRVRVSSLDQIGPFARDVARRRGAAPRGRRPRRARLDLGRRCRCPTSCSTCRRATTRPRAGLRGKRLGLPREYFVAGMEPDVEARIHEAVAALEAAGAIVEEVSLPHTDYGLATYYIVAPAEASANLARYDGDPLRAARSATATYIGDYLATRGQRLRRRRSSAGSCSGRTRCRPATTTPTT